MRLRQLARKLEIDTEKLIHFLDLQGLPCDDDSNAKLTDDQEEILIKEFGPLPDTAGTVIVEAEEEVVPIEIEEDIREEPAAQITETEFNDDITVQISDSDPETPTETPSESISEPEVIRAPKVELSGLKVVGKIELRTPKKKEEPKDPAPEETTFKSKDPQNRRKGKPQKKSNPIAEQRKREEKIKQRRKKEAEELAKKKRTANYLRKVKGKEKIVLKKEKDNSENLQQPKAKEKAGLLRKFFNWMRRE